MVPVMLLVAMMMMLAMMMELAMMMTCPRPTSQRKMLAVYLHHDSSVLTNVFCTQVTSRVLRPGVVASCHETLTPCPNCRMCLCLDVLTSCPSVPSSRRPDILTPST